MLKKPKPLKLTYCFYCNVRMWVKRRQKKQMCRLCSVLEAPLEGC